MNYSLNLMMKIILILPIYILFSCISLTVYIPHKGESPLKSSPYAIKNDIDIITLIRTANNFNNNHLPEKINIEGNSNLFFAHHSPCLFFMENKKLKNLYGKLNEVIAKDIMYYPDNYSLPLKSLKIKINKFQLDSNDKCFNNIVSISLDIEVAVESMNSITKIYHYSYNDAIHSSVTDLYFISILGTIPALIQSGFRGNRQDQLNRLGRNALNDFSLKLRKDLQNDKMGEGAKTEMAPVKSTHE